MNTPVFTINSDTDMDDNFTYTYCYFFIDASNNNVTIELTETFINYGVYYEFLRIDNSANTVTINAKNGYTINGNSSITVAGNQYVYMINNGSNWHAPKMNVAY